MNENAGLALATVHDLRSYGRPAGYPGYQCRCQGHCHARVVLLIAAFTGLVALVSCRTSPSGSASHSEKSESATSSDSTVAEVVATPTPGDSERDSASAAASDVSMPMAPEIVQPSTAWVHGRPLEVAWRSVRHAESYQLIVSRSPSLSPPLLERTVPAHPDVPTGTLVQREVDVPTQPGETLHVGIRAASDGGVSSSVTHVAVPVRFATPQVVRPRPSALVESERPRFEWTPIVGATAYEVEVLDGDAGLAPSTVLQVKIPADNPVFKALQPLSRTGSLRVRVRPFGDAVQGEWSKERSFIYDPARPRILQPVMNESVISRRPLFKWVLRTSISKESSESAVFDIEICTQDARGECDSVFVSESNVTLYRPALDLARDRAHRVRVRRKTDVLWSDPVVFTVRAERPHPLPVRPLVSPRDRHEWRSASSVDGELLAIVSRAVPILGDDRDGARWEVAILERDPSSATPFFRVVPGTSVEVDDDSRIASPSLDWVYGSGPSSTLYLATPAGGVHTLEGWNQLVKMPFSLAGSVAAISVGETFAGQASQRRRERLFLEVRRDGSQEFESPWGGFEPGRTRSAEHGELWSVSPNGSDLRLVTLGGDPALSPDGRALAYTTRNVDSLELRLLSLDGSQLSTRLPGAGPIRDVRGLAWSPDSRYLAYARDIGLGFDIVVLHLDSGRETMVTGAFAPELYPCFLPSNRLDRAFDGIIFTTLPEGTASETWSLQFVEFQG